MKTDEEIRDCVRGKLVECRKEFKLTQTQVGELVGKKKTTVASWEQGQTVPGIETLYKLAAYYNKSLDFMFGEKDQ